LRKRLDPSDVDAIAIGLLPEHQWLSFEAVSFAWRALAKP